MKLSQKLRNEVALVWGAVLTGINAAQAVALDVPKPVHGAIFIATSVLTFLGIRARVTPTTTG